MFDKDAILRIREGPAIVMGWDGMGGEGVVDAAISRIWEGPAIVMGLEGGSRCRLWWKGRG